MLYEEKTIYIPHGPLALPYLLLIVHLGKDISIMASDLPKERAGISKLTARSITDIIKSYFGISKVVLAFILVL